MPNSSSTPPFLIILFLLLLCGTEIMSILTMTGILAIPGVRWDIMPALCSILTMLACALTFVPSPPRPGSRPNRRPLISFISIGILALVIANIGLRPWAPSPLYSTVAIAIGIAAFTAGWITIRRRP